ncbi:MAG: hypothetical protein ACI30M_06150 [Muribaculaceae bacterium]
MSIFNNWFSRLCFSGFGTGTAAGKAAGIVIFIMALGLILLIWIISLIIKQFTKKSNSENE